MPPTKEIITKADINLFHKNKDFATSMSRMVLAGDIRKTSIYGKFVVTRLLKESIPLPSFEKSFFEEPLGGKS